MTKGLTNRALIFCQMAPMLGTLKSLILRLAFPRKCHCCSNEVLDATLGVACQRCWIATTILDGTESTCPKCGRISANETSGFNCRACDGHFYDLARSLSLYEKAAKATLLHLKRVPVIPEILRKQTDMFDSLVLCQDVDVVIPVPLSPQRAADRGFNQAEVIASTVGKVIHKPIDTVSLIRTKHSPMHRAAMDKKARESSVENAFSVVRRRLITDKNILLVDDIFTSGATASNCAKALKTNGARSVKVFTLARTN